MKLYIKTAIFLLAVISITTSGCLKDEEFDNGSIQSVHSTDGVPKIVELKLSAASASNFATIGVENSDKDTVADLVPVNLATAAPAPEDLHVTVELDSALVKQYNADNGTDYAIPSSSIYSIVNSVVTIPKGSHTGYLQVKFNPSDYLGLSVALGFRIASIQEKGYTISGNLNTGIASIIVKNEWDGKYDVHVEIDGSNGYAGTKFDDTGIALSTASANAISENSIADFFGGYTLFTFKDDGTMDIKAGGSSSDPNGYGAVVKSSSYDKSNHSFKAVYTILGGKYIFTISYVKE